MSSACFGRNRISLAALAVCGAVGLAACGSGSSDDEGPAEAGLTLGGTAATGLAIAGQPVAAKCDGGGGDAVTNADGSYTITVAGGASLPCMLRVTTADGQVLHSLAVGTGATARANITPVSELVVARLAGGDPAAFFEGFDSGSAGALGSESVQAAAAAIVETLKKAGVDLGDFDVLGGELIAATSAGASGNAFDQALDALGAALEATGTSLAQLIETVALASPQAGQAPSGLPSLPAEMLLKTAAKDCPSFRSGTYRILLPMEEYESIRATTLVVDAAALTARWADDAAGAPSSTRFIPVDQEQCRYDVRFDGKPGQLAVSASGVGILTVPGDPGVFEPGLMFPEQAIPVSELAGDWNSLEWEREDAFGAFASLSTEFTITDEGVLTNMKDCAGPNFDGCEVEDAGEAETFEAHPKGGYHLVNQAYEDGARVFAYRAGGGELMIAAVDPTNTLVLATKKRSAGLPEVGDSMATWAFAIKADGSAYDGSASSIASWIPGAMDSSGWKVSARDEAAGTFERTNPAGTRTQPFRIDVPRQGFMQREQSAYGSEMVFLGFRGMGFTALSSVRTDADRFFMLSVAKPEPSTAQ